MPKELATWPMCAAARAVETHLAHAVVLDGRLGHRLLVESEEAQDLWARGRGRAVLWVRVAWSPCMHPPPCALHPLVGRAALASSALARWPPPLVNSLVLFAGQGGRGAASPCGRWSPTSAGGCWRPPQPSGCRTCGRQSGRVSRRAQRRPRLTGAPHWRSPWCTSACASGRSWVFPGSAADRQHDEGRPNQEGIVNQDMHMASNVVAIPKTGTSSLVRVGRASSACTAMPPLPAWRYAQ